MVRDYPGLQIPAVILNLCLDILSILQLKITVDLQGCLLENAFFMRCFKENHGKLYIISLLS